jgi:hypothetical protein
LKALLKTPEKHVGKHPRKHPESSPESTLKSTPKATLRMATAAPTQELDPALFPGIIQHRPEHRLLYCRPCSAAMFPKGLHRHLQAYHRVPIEQRRLLLQHCGSLDLITQAKDIQLPLNHSPALQFLPVQKGYSCRQPQCPYLTTNEDNMRGHINQAHKLFYQACTDSFQSVQLQSWFLCGRAREG